MAALGWSQLCHQVFVYPPSRVSRSLRFQVDLKLISQKNERRHRAESEKIIYLMMVFLITLHKWFSNTYTNLSFLYASEIYVSKEEGTAKEPVIVSMEKKYWP